VKKVFGIILAIASVGIMMLATDCTVSSRNQTEAIVENTAQQALDTSPVPQVTYFQERRTIKKFTEYYDRAAVATYVYLFTFGQPVGYFVADGKPASIRSYLVPEDSVQYTGHGSYELMQAQALDGTYGEDNPGIRFFTAAGIPVEFGGTGISYLYSPQPLALNVPRLYTDKK